jgi:hypothetical protein
MTRVNEVVDGLHMIEADGGSTHPSKICIDFYFLDNLPPKNGNSAKSQNLGVIAKAVTLSILSAAEEVRALADRKTQNGMQQMEPLCWTHSTYLKRECYIATTCIIYSVLVGQS